MFEKPLFFLIFWLLFAIAFGLFVYRGYQLFCWIRLGAYENRFDHLGKRVMHMIGQVFLQICSLKSVSKKDMAGIGHAFIFWAFLIFLVSYIIYIFIGDGLGISEIIRNTSFSRYFSLAVDIAGFLAVLAVIWAALRRYIIKPERLERTPEAAIILAIVFTLVLAHFSIEGFRINTIKDSVAAWTPLSLGFASFFKWLGLEVGLQGTLYKITWWFHYLIIIGFLIYIPYSKHLHIMVSPLNILFSSLRPNGSLESIDLEKADTYGVNRIEEFTWKQLLDLYACAQCGRCQANCPAYLTGKPLNPKKMILDLKEYLFEMGQSLLKSKSATVLDPPLRPLIGGVIPEDVLWACTTCGACIAHCPTFNNHVTKIIEIRRNLILDKSTFPSELKILFRNVENNGNPFPKASLSRGDWALGLNINKFTEDVDKGILYWVGCLGSYDERVQRVSMSLYRVLRAMGITIWILGKDEQCCGDSVRRAGNEYLFQYLAKENIRRLKKHGVKKIVTHCPHCFNTLKNEYPQFGANFEVIHHLQLLDELKQRLRFRSVGDEPKISLTYHDPCYLGRYNGIYEPARNILRTIPAVRIAEMNHSKKESLCCGSGGGRMWMREQPGRRISQECVEEALRAKADIIATGCPFCLIMLEDAVRALNVVRVMDVVEVIENSF